MNKSTSLLFESLWVSLLFWFESLWVSLLFCCSLIVPNSKYCKQLLRYR